MRTLTLAMILFACALVQSRSDPDLNSLVGKRVTAQRMPLCQPGTYTVVLSYAGKQGTAVSIKPFKIATESQDVLDQLSEQARTAIEDASKSAVVLIQFDDGTQLDTCAPVSPAKLKDYFELATGDDSSPSGDSPATAAAASPAAASAVTPDSLSADEVTSALSGIGIGHWVAITDMGLMAAQGNQVPSITLYMPDAVLAIRAAAAKKQFVRYEPMEEDKQRSLTIVAEGYAGKTITEGCTSITRIVILSNSSGGVVKEAYLSEPLSEVWRNGFGATNECQSLRAKFSLADVQRVKEAAPNGEFFVAVFAGSVNTKVYKIKRKHESKLGLQ